MKYYLFVDKVTGLLSVKEFDQSNFVFLDREKESEHLLSNDTDLLTCSIFQLFEKEPDWLYEINNKAYDTRRTISKQSNADTFCYSASTTSGSNTATSTIVGRREFGNRYSGMGVQDYQSLVPLCNCCDDCFLFGLSEEPKSDGDLSDHRYDDYSRVI